MEGVPKETLGFDGGKKREQADYKNLRIPLGDKRYVISTRSSERKGKRILTFHRVMSNMPAVRHIAFPLLGFYHSTDHRICIDINRQPGRSTSECLPFNRLTSTSWELPESPRDPLYMCCSSCGVYTARIFKAPIAQAPFIARNSQMRFPSRKPARS